MRAKLLPCIRKDRVFSPSEIAPEALSLDFYKSSVVGVSEEEFVAASRFQRIVSVSKEETELLRRRIPSTHVTFAPTPVEISGCATPHSTQFALFPMGPNPFNLQGYAWFVEKVMPKILRSCPEFCLAVSGVLCEKELEHHPNVRILGFVRNVQDLWTMARFMVNPVFGGTGQPIKTIEAMGAGLASVVQAKFATEAPITHGITGFVATTEQEFAEHCVHLWKNPRECIRVGAAAAEAIAKAYSRAHFLELVSEVLNVGKRPHLGLNPEQLNSRMCVV
jgi:hypothetical protein